MNKRNALPLSGVEGIETKEEIKKSIEDMTEQELNKEIGERVRLLTDEEKVKLVCLLLELAASE